MLKWNGQLEILLCLKEAMLGPYSSLPFLVCLIAPILVSLKITLIWVSTSFILILIVVLYTEVSGWKLPFQVSEFLVEEELQDVLNCQGA